MAYKCPECYEIFDEPDFVEICMEDYNGVSSMFPTRNYKTFAKCPYCNTTIDVHYDYYDEDEQEEEEDEE